MTVDRLHYLNHRLTGTLCNPNGVTIVEPEIDHRLPSLPPKHFKRDLHQPDINRKVKDPVRPDYLKSPKIPGRINPHCLDSKGCFHFALIE
ncbi:MAG: hypothetical protein JWR69_2754 [Pedosphaera sp.]|nr:hypothetical protein [Pedosphaera sp.]